MATGWCPQCGRPEDGAPHEACQRRAELEPPRFCTRCGNRLDVQVWPTGFVATCRRCDDVHPARRTSSDA